MKIVKASADVMPIFVGIQSELAIAKLYTDSVDFREALTEYERCGFLLSAFVPKQCRTFPASAGNGLRDDPFRSRGLNDPVSSSMTTSHCLALKTSRAGCNLARPAMLTASLRSVKKPARYV